jgi:hypothetical protein
VTGVGRRYLDAIGECLDLEPESAHEVMAELENHFVEEAAHNANDPQDVAERRVISRLGSPRSLAARLNRGPRARRAGDPVISLWLSFDTYRRWRKAMAAIVAVELYTLTLLAYGNLAVRLLFSDFSGVRGRGTVVFRVPLVDPLDV